MFRNATHPTNLSLQHACTHIDTHMHTKSRRPQKLPVEEGETPNLMQGCQDTHARTHARKNAFRLFSCVLLADLYCLTIRLLSGDSDSDLVIDAAAMVIYRILPEMKQRRMLLTLPNVPYSCDLLLRLPASHSVSSAQPQRKKRTTNETPLHWPTRQSVSSA